MIHGRVAGDDINRRKNKGDYYGGVGGGGGSVHCQGDQRVLERIRAGQSWQLNGIRYAFGLKLNLLAPGSNTCM